MLPRGRPPGPGTAEEKAAIRREKVRLNVKAYRERKKNAALAAAPAVADPPHISITTPPPLVSSQTSPSSSDFTDNDRSEREDSEKQSEAEPECRHEVVVRSKRQLFPRSRQATGDGSKSWSIGNTLWVAPDTAPIFSDAHLSVFRSFFLPTKVILPRHNDNDSPALVTPCSPWIMNAYNLANQQDNGTLRSGLLAIGLVLNGLQHSSNELKVASFKMHRQAILRLRNDLEPANLQRQRTRSAASVFLPYLSCLAVTMFELIQTGFSQSMLQHLKALNSLIEMIYMDTTIDQFMANLIMEDFGMLEMLFCLKYGLHSVLRHTRRKFKLRSTGSGLEHESQKNASVYGDILDMVEELPSLLIQMKSLQLQSCSEPNCNRLKGLVRKLAKMQGTLDEWKTRFEQRHGSIVIRDAFPSAAEGDTATRSRLRSYEHAAVGLFVFNFELCALDASIEAMGTLAQFQRRQSLSSEEALNESSVSFSPIPLAGLVTPQTRDASTSTIPIQDDFDHESISVQRSRTRSLIMQLLEIMDHYAKIADNLSGQSLMVNPCDTVKSVLDKERNKLGEELMALRPEDYDGTIRVNQTLREVVDAEQKFAMIVQRLQQHNFSTMDNN